MIKVSDAAFPYLVAQVGELDSFSDDRKLWEDAYNSKMEGRLENISPHVPANLSSILDVGSGLGGIDILLHRSFGGPRIVLMDGDTGKSVSRRHDVPFCSAEVALDFQRDNGVHDATFMRCDAPVARPFDLITSYRAWCFHIAPRVYLEYVLRCCHADTRVILDVRRRSDWEDELLEIFDGHTIAEWEKCRRWALIRK